jgi:hypothetical protein
MNKFRAEEIVVQDVAVQVRVLRPGSAYIGASDNGAVSKSVKNPKQ